DKPEDDRRYILRMGSVQSFEALSLLLQTYHVRRCVVDALPEIHACKAWADKHRGIVVRAYYPESADLRGQLFHPEPEKIDDVVNINRTMAMDAVYANIATAKEVWPQQWHDDPEV